MTDCIFCAIAAGKASCHKIWEDEKHLAFLSIFPNTKGFSVVITKRHHPSYAFDLPDHVLASLVLAAKRVGPLLDRRLEDIGRTGLILEGFAVTMRTPSCFPCTAPGCRSGDHSAGPPTDISTSTKVTSRRTTTSAPTTLS